MIARPAFGDFITAARGHVGAAAAGHQADRSGEHVQEITDASPSLSAQPNPNWPSQAADRSHQPAAGCQPEQPEAES
jgi:hypothetical protein